MSNRNKLHLKRIPLHVLKSMMEIQISRASAGRFYIPLLRVSLAPMVSTRSVADPAIKRFVTNECLRLHILGVGSLPLAWSRVPFCFPLLLVLSSLSRLISDKVILLLKTMAGPSPSSSLGSSSSRSSESDTKICDSCGSVPSK